jgi:non-ribosomal peptide synthetase component F
MNIHTGEAVLGNDIGPPIPERVRRLIERQPERVALVSGSTSLTYRQLGAEVDSLVRALLARGVDRGCVVGLCLERSSELVVAALAVVTAGAAYLALDPAQPPDRSRRMLSESGAKLLVTRGADGKSLAGSAVDSLYLDRPDDSVPADGVHEPAPVDPPVVGHDDLAYVTAAWPTSWTGIRRRTGSPSRTA